MLPKRNDTHIAKNWEQWTYPTTPHSSEETYNKIIQLIKNNINFSFLRMGDGDIKAYLNIPQNTILEEPYRTIYEKSLDPIFKYKEETNDLNLTIGIENKTPCTDDIYTRHKNYSSILDAFYQRFKHTDALSINCITFMHMYVYYGLNEFFKSLRDRRVILVGPSHQKNMKFQCIEKYHITTPITYSWEYHENYEESLTLLLDKIKDPVIIYGCAVTGKMLFSKMFFKYPNITQIDVGAALDPYAGAPSRPWHKSENINII